MLDFPDTVLPGRLNLPGFLVFLLLSISPPFVVFSHIPGPNGFRWLCRTLSRIGSPGFGYQAVYLNALNVLEKEMFIANSKSLLYFWLVLFLSIGNSGFHLNWKWTHHELFRTSKILRVSQDLTLFTPRRAVNLVGGRPCSFYPGVFQRRLTRMKVCRV